MPNAIANDNHDDLHMLRANAGFTAALSHLLLGAPGRLDDFLDRVDVILGGPPPHLAALMRMTGRARDTGRPTLWVHHCPDNPLVPLIGLLAPIGEGTHVLENCMLHMGRRDDRARLVPDCFRLGAYVLDDRLRLRHERRAPARTYEDAKTAMGRTYARLYEIQAEQAERGDAFPLPTRVRAA